MIVIQTALSSLMGLTSYGKKVVETVKVHKLYHLSEMVVVQMLKLGVLVQLDKMNSSSVGSTAQTSLIV